MNPSMQAVKSMPEGCRTFPAETNHTAPGPGRPSSRQIKAGCELFRPGETCVAIHYLVDGCIFVYDLLEDGRRQILHFALPGAVLGLYPNRVTIYGAQALTDSTVCTIPQDSLGSLFQRHPKAGLQLMWSVWKERNLAYDHLSSVGRRSSRERVARLLLELYVRFRMRWPDHDIQEMRLPLTQEHIGDATGLTNVHVNRILQRLRAEGILEFHYGRLRIINPDKLADVAGLDPGIAVWGCPDNARDEVIAAVRLPMAVWP